MGELEETLELKLQFEKRGGLLPAIAQDYWSAEILMLGYVNQQALDETIKTGQATFWSTSRNELWTKGKTSGDILEIQDILVDCDQDAIVYIVKRLGGGACHTKDQKNNYRGTCFYRTLKKDGKLEFIEELK